MGKVDGGAGRGITLGGHDERPPTGYQNTDEELPEPADPDLGWEEEEDPADRRRDPLRRP